MEVGERWGGQLGEGRGEGGLGTHLPAMTTPSSVSRFRNRYLSLSYVLCNGSQRPNGFSDAMIQAKEVCRDATRLD
jgi:hypothetical protein